MNDNQQDGPAAKALVLGAVSSEGCAVRGPMGHSLARRPHHQAVLVASVAVALGLVASAGDSAMAEGRPPIVLESRVDETQKDERYFLDFMVRSMGADATTSGSALREQIENTLSRAAGTSGDAKKIRHLIEDGSRFFIEGEFEQSVALLEKARSRLMKKAGMVASEQTLRDALHKALLVLAHCYLRLGQPDRATELVGQVVRSYPDRDLSMVDYSPELVDFYKKVRREMGRQPRGSLTINTAPHKCLVFLNERFVGLSPARVVGLYPGRYRVYVQRPRETGRIHFVTVNGGERQTSVDFNLDRVLETEAFVGLSFRDEEDRMRLEARYASALARALDSPMAIVLGTMTYEGRRVIRGTAISAGTGRIIRSGMVALEPAAPPAATLKALGAFLTFGKPARGIIVDKDAVAAIYSGPSKDGAKQGGSVLRVLKWIGAGLAVAGIGAGVTLMVMDGRGDCGGGGRALCESEYQTMTAGISAVSAGGALALGSALMFWLDARGRPKEKSAPAPAPQAGLAPIVGRSTVGLGATYRF